MAKGDLSKQDARQIDELVAHYVTNQQIFERALDQLAGWVQGSNELKPYIHSTKSRLKDPAHLRDKLIRKLNEEKSKKRKLNITPSNLFSKINDLAGFRILHLYTRQIEPINHGLIHIFNEAQFQLLEGPKARTWDDESREYFREIGIPTEKSPTMYTSVHYVIKANSLTKCTCEIQVRTLMEEVWGEVDHKINYPRKAKTLACREQIKVLARVTSSCTRLVDSIFRSHEEGTVVRTPKLTRPKAKSPRPR